MKTYRMPVSLNEEDKVFGGVLSTRQFLTLAGGFIAGGAGVLALPSGFWAGVLKVVGAALFLGLGAAFAFGRVTPRELRLDQYLVLRIMSRRAPRDFPYRGWQTPGEAEGVQKVGLLAWFLAKAAKEEDSTGRPGLSGRGGRSRRDA